MTSTSSTPRRRTRQREAIEEYLADQSVFRSAQDIHADLRAAGDNIGLATVYRALQAMVDDGEIDVLRLDDGEQQYRRCGAGTDHHHHLVCRQCGFAVEVLDQPVARWADEVGRTHGFTEIEHRVEVFGVCADCR